MKRPRAPRANGWICNGDMGLVMAIWDLLLMAALCTVMVGACATRVAPEAFSISLVPTVPVPIRVGTDVGFRLSSATAGYASLYLIDPVGQVSVLAENLPLAAGSLDYPSSAQGFTLTASQPVGVNRVILLVTRQPFNGFSGEATLTSPVSLALSRRRVPATVGTVRPPSCPIGRGPGTKSRFGSWDDGRMARCVPDCGREGGT